MVVEMLQMRGVFTIRTAWIAAVALIVGVGEVGAQSPPTDADGESESDRAADAAMSDVPLLTRSEAVEEAVEANHGIEIERVRTEIADRNVSLGNAGYLPSLAGVVGQSHQFGGPGFFGAGEVYTQTSFGLELNWLAFDGFRRPATYNRLELERSVQSLQRAAEIETTLLDVTTAYANIRRQKRLVEALIQTRELSETRLQIAQTRLEAETGSKVDVNLARVELNQDRSAVSEQRIALVEAKTALNRTLGRSADTEFRVEGDIDVTDAIAYEETRQRAMEANRRLQAARRQVDIAGKEISEAQADRWPDVNLGLGYTYTGFHGGVIPNFETAPSLEYGIDIRIPIFEGFNIGRRINNAKSRETVADLEVRSEKTRIRAELRDAFEAYERHLERVELARKTVELAEENVDVGLTELRAGTISQVELRQVQLNLLQAKQRLINAKYRAKVAALNLRQLAGRLYDQLL